MIFTLAMLFSLKHLLSPEAHSQMYGRLEIQCEIETIDKGELYVALFNESGNFPEAGAHFQRKKIPLVAKQSTSIVFDQVPFGRYAIAVFQDVNNNGKFDKNLWGIPTEPYGFSMNPKAKWKKPSYEESSFQINQFSHTLEIQIKYWKSR